jgi:thiol:disulfide interchange protein DsbD
MFNARLSKYRWGLILLLSAILYVSLVTTGTIRSQELPRVATEALDYADVRGDLLIQAEGESNVERDPQEGDARSSIWWILLAIFLGGLALNLTPCVYPLIPITISYFGGKGQRIRGYTIIHGIIYLFGLAVTNSVLGLTAALSGGMLGFALQNPFVLIFVACVIVAMGLSFFGLWELRLPLWLTRLASKSYAGFFGTFFMGLTLGIVAAPCIGPFILGLLVYVGQLGNPFLGFLYFFVLSIGLGLPLSVLAIFSGVITRLPKSGDWMLWIRKLMGWVLMGMAAFMVGPVLPSPIIKSSLMAGVFVAAGIHLGWLDRTWGKLGIFSYLKKAMGVALMCGGIIYLALGVRPAGEIEWIHYDQTTLANVVKEKKPVLLEFYAAWCGPCRAMEKEVFTDPEVIKLSRDFVSVRVDLTTVKPFHDELLRRYQIRGIPAVILLNSEGIEARAFRIEGYVGKHEFAERLRVFLDQSLSTKE